MMYLKHVQVANNMTFVKLLQMHFLLLWTVIIKIFFKRKVECFPKKRNLRKFKKIKTVNLEIRIEIEKILSLHKNIYIFEYF